MTGALCQKPRHWRPARASRCDRLAVPCCSPLLSRPGFEEFQSVTPDLFSPGARMRASDAARSLSQCVGHAAAAGLRGRQAHQHQRRCGPGCLQAASAGEEDPRLFYLLPCQPAIVKHLANRLR